MAEPGFGRIATSPTGVRRALIQVESAKCHKRSRISALWPEFEFYIFETSLTNEPILFSVASHTRSCGRLMSIAAWFARTGATQRNDLYPVPCSGQGSFACRSKLFR